MAKKNQKSTPSPVFWIFGNYYESRKSWRQIVELLKDPLVDILDDCSAGDVILHLKTPDMFDDRPRITKLISLPDDYTILSDYLHLVNDNNVLVILAPPAATSNLYKRIAANGRILESSLDARNESDAVRWVQSVIKDYGKTIETEAAELLVSMRGCNFDHLYVEIEKLTAYQQDKKITVSDVESCCVSTFVKSVWTLIDNIDSTNTEDVMEHCETFFRLAGLETGKSLRSESEMLFGALSYHYLFLLFCKDASDQHFDKASIAKKISGYRKLGTETKNDAFNNRTIAIADNSKSFRNALKWPISKIYATYLATLHCRNRMRMVYGDEFAKVCVSAFCMFACNIINQNQLKNLTN